MVNSSHVLVVLNDGLGLQNGFTATGNMPGSPLHWDVTVAVNGGKYSDFPFVCPFDGQHALIHTDHVLVTRLHLLSYRCRYAKSVDSECATCTKPVQPQVIEESWGGVIIVHVDMVHPIFDGLGFTVVLTFSLCDVILPHAYALVFPLRLLSFIVM